MTTAAEKLDITRDDRLELAHSLIRHIEEGNEVDTNRIISQLYTGKEQSLFQEIGKLTRQLHDALGSCRNDERLSSLAEKDMPDARQRLGYVMEKTESSAHKTLGAVEKALPLSDELKAE
ncbi:MAG: protein phosphatase CheZ, partial [Thiotrichales bacterium]|nr:protein phosphatase CheZ [Thiotrichales bacterium]